MTAPGIKGFGRTVLVGIADLAVSKDPNDILTGQALGSCLGIAVYDPQTRVGGLLHAMLPDSHINTTLASNWPAMFLDTAIPQLVRAVCEMGADRQRLLVYVAGGAQILDKTGFFNLGKRNYRTVVDLLQTHGLQTRAEDVGGLANRTLSLQIADGRAAVRIVGQRKEITL